MSFFNNANTAATGAPAPPQSLFGNPPNPGSSTNSQPAAPAPTSNIFGGGMFGAATPAAATSSTDKPTPSLFGTGTSGGGLFGAPKSDAPAAPKASFFNIPPATSGTTTPAPSLGNAPALGSGLFPPKPSTTPAPAPAGGLFGAPPTNATAEKKDTAPSPFGLFGAPKDPAKKDAPAAAPAMFSNPGASSSSTEKKDAAPAAPSLFGSFGAKPAEKAATPSTGNTLLNPGDKPKDASANPLGLSALGGAGLATGGTNNALAATPAVAVAPPSMLRGKTIEEIVNRWSADLETHVREFNKFAGEVAVWDRGLIENGNHLAALFSHVLAAEREQDDIDQSLDHIEQQQKDLASTLDAYEKSAHEVLGGQTGNLRALDTGPADTERDRNYVLATGLHSHLDDLSGSLTQMIETVNGLSPLSDTAHNSSSGDDPMAQIAEILSGHLESLQWIDGAVREVEGKVTEVEKRVRDSGAGNNGRSSASPFGANR